MQASSYRTWHCLESSLDLPSSVLGPSVGVQLNEVGLNVEIRGEARARYR